MAKRVVTLGDYPQPYDERAMMVADAIDAAFRQQRADADANTQHCLGTMVPVAELRAAAADISRLQGEYYALVLTNQEQIRRREAAEDECARLRAALQSIANSACCGGCQEAALVARAALGAAIPQERG